MVDFYEKQIGGVSSGVKEIILVSVDFYEKQIGGCKAIVKK